MHGPETGILPLRDDRLRMLCSTTLGEDKVYTQVLLDRVGRHTHSQSFNLSTQCIRVVLSAPAVLQWRTAVI